MTDSENTKEYTNQSTLGVESSAEIKNQTNQSLESLEGEIKLTPAEEEAIKQLPDYNESASPEEQEARIAYFTKMKNELLIEIEGQKKKSDNETSELSQALQEIPIIQKRANGLSERKVEGKSDFEKLIIYLGNKNTTKLNAVECSAIDIGIWLKYPASSSYLMDRRNDYSHMDEVVKYKEIKENEKKQTTENVEKGIKGKSIKEPERMPLGDGKGFDPETKPHLFENGNGFSVNTMKSYPFERGPKKIGEDGKEKKGTTLCSLTTRLNLEMLGLPNPPRGDALAAMLKPDYFDYGPLVGSIFTDQFKPEWEKIRDKYGKKDISQQEDCITGDIAKSVEDMGIKSYANCGEIYLSSNRHPQYGHRAAIFKAEEDGERYVLDPYVGGAGTKAQPLETYLNKCESKGRKVYRVNLFQSQA